ncbi:MAG: 3-deoxy-D-manno-octulosonic acid transferase [Chlorobiales bacterium]
MLRFWRALYNLLFPLFLLAARLVGKFNPKVKATLQGRKNLFFNLTEQVKTLPPNRKRIWFHVASVGEFEQARPLISELRKENNWAIIVSFLSVSGYEARKNFPDADLVCYLPEDTPENARQFCALIQPQVAVVVRYDFWLNHLLEAKRVGATLILISASVQAKSNYFKPVLKSFYQTLFSCFDKIFTVTEQDAQLFQNEFNHRAIEAAGDTRYDQVFERSRQRSRIAHLEQFYQGTQTLIGGSTWQIDEELLLQAFTGLECVALILAPHELGKANLARLESLLNVMNLPFARASNLPADFSSARVLIVDEMGYLAELYSLASVAYIGGGFGVNVHNTLEAAVYGIPVLFGGNIHNSREAKELAESGGGFIVTETSLQATLKRLFENDYERQIAGRKAAQFVAARLGATENILNYLTTLEIASTRKHDAKRIINREHKFDG